MTARRRDEKKGKCKTLLHDYEEENEKKKRRRKNEEKRHFRSQKPRRQMKRRALTRTKSRENTHRKKGKTNECATA